MAYSRTVLVNILLFTLCLVLLPTFHATPLSKNASCVGCIYMQNTEVCLEACPQAFYHTGLPVSLCTSNKSASGLSMPSDAELSANLSWLVCAKCDASCQHCWGPGWDNCTSCAEGYTEGNHTSSVNHSATQVHCVESAGSTSGVQTTVVAAVVPWVLLLILVGLMAHFAWKRGYLTCIETQRKKLLHNLSSVSVASVESKTHNPLIQKGLETHNLRTSATRRVQPALNANTVRETEGPPKKPTSCAPGDNVQANQLAEGNTKQSPIKSDPATTTFQTGERKQEKPKDASENTNCAARKEDQETPTANLTVETSGALNEQGTNHPNEPKLEIILEARETQEQAVEEPRFEREHYATTGGKQVIPGPHRHMHTWPSSCRSVQETAKRHEWGPGYSVGSVLSDDSITETSGYASDFEEGLHTSVGEDGIQPILAQRWHFVGELSAKGGTLQGNHSDVVLTIPKGAVPDGQNTLVQGAVFTDLVYAHEKLKLPENEVLASPVVEYHAIEHYTFKRFLKIKLPHFVPDHALVKMYMFYRDGSGELVLQRLEKDNKDDTRQSRTCSEKEPPVYSSGEGNVLIVRANHFSGYCCVFDCKRSYSPPVLILKLYARHFEDTDERSVDVHLKIWDERVNIRDFQESEQKTVIDDELKYLDKGMLLRLPSEEDLESIALGMVMDLRGDGNKKWMHQLDGKGNPVEQVEQVMELRHFVPCNCQSKIPWTSKWYLVNKPNVPMSDIFKGFLYVGYVKTSTGQSLSPMEFLEKPARVTFRLRIITCTVHDRTRPTQNTSRALVATQSQTSSDDEPGSEPSTEVKHISGRSFRPLQEQRASRSTQNEASSISAAEEKQPNQTVNIATVNHLTLNN